MDHKHNEIRKSKSDTTKKRRCSFAAIGDLYPSREEHHVVSTPSLTRLHNTAVFDLSQKTDQSRYTEFQQGLLCKNTVEFTDVDFCFVCNAKSNDQWVLKPSIEITGMKFYTPSGDMLPVYRQLFLCPPCRVVVDEKKQNKLLLSSSVVKITNEAHAYFF